jgi:hypothetical protein
MQVATTLVPTHLELPTTQVPTHSPRPWQVVLAGQFVTMNPTPLPLQTSACVMSMQAESLALQATSVLATHEPAMQVEPDWQGALTQVPSEAHTRATMSLTHSVAAAVHFPSPLLLPFPHPTATIATATSSSRMDPPRCIEAGSVEAREFLDGEFA